MFCQCSGVVTACIKDGRAFFSFARAANINTSQLRSRVTMGVTLQPWHSRMYDALET